MPRRKRNVYDSVIYHVLNRGNNKQKIFSGPDDYDAFLALLHQAKSKYPVNILAYCLMPNHFHMVLQAAVGENIGRNMHWLLTTHACRYQTKFDVTGHVWQGRFKSFPVQDDHHLITLLRYVEGNPVRAGMVASCKEWAWSSVNVRVPGSPYPLLISPSPVILPEKWVEYVDEPIPTDKIKAIRLGVEKQIPFGDSIWCSDSAGWSLENNLHRRGRPSLSKSN